MMKKQKSIANLALSFLLLSTVFTGCSNSTTESENEPEEVISETVQDENTADESIYYEPNVVYGIEYAQSDDDSLSVSLLVYLINGSFAEDFNTQQITFQGDLANAQNIQIVDIDTQHQKAEISFTLDNTDLDPADLHFNAKLTFADGSILDELETPASNLEFEQELSFSDTQRSSDTLETIYFSDTKTIVYRISKEGPADFFAFLDFYEGIVSGSRSYHYDISYFIFDFSNANSTLKDYLAVAMGAMNVIESEYNAKTVVINLKDKNAYEEFSDLRDYAGFKIQLVSGNTSDLNFNDKNIYSSIQEQVQSGKLKEN
jgi:hypothetical protein